MKSCSNCDLYRAAKCALNPVHLDVAPDHYCGQWRNAIHAGPRSHNAVKATDREIFMELCAMPEAAFGLEWADVQHKLCARFSVSRQTIHDRLKRLQFANFIEIFRRESDNRKLVRYALRDPDDPAGKIEPKEWVGESMQSFAPSEIEKPRKLKWTWPEVTKAMIPGEPMKYSVIAKLCPQIGRGPFNRCLNEAVAAGAVECVGGKYRLRKESAP